MPNLDPQLEKLDCMKSDVVWLIDNKNDHVSMLRSWNLTIDKSVYFYKRSNNKSIVIHEMYQISSTVIVRKVGIWTERLGLVFSKMPFLLRRANFYGLEFAGTTVNDAPFTAIQGIDPTTGNVKATGMVHELWAELEKRLNFSTTLIHSIDGTWGSLQSDGTMSGMIGMLQRKEVEVALAGFIIMKDRAEAADFVTPFFEEQ